MEGKPAMITRFEMWQYKQDEDVNKEELVHNIGYSLKALVGSAQGLVNTELICSNGKSSHDIMIVTTFENEEDLLAFEEDGAYEVFGDVYLSPYFTKRAVVDKEATSEDN